MNDIMRGPQSIQTSSISIATTTGDVEQQQYRRTHSAPTSPTTNNNKNTKEFDTDYRAYFNSPQQGKREPTIEDGEQHKSSRHQLFRSKSTFTGTSSCNTKQKTTKHIYDSPRLYESDSILFPASKNGPLRNTKYLQSYESRYQYIQQQQQQSNNGTTGNNNNAQHHDMSTLHIQYDMIHIRQIVPKSIQYGIVPSCSIRIQTLYIPLLPIRRCGTDPVERDSNPPIVSRTNYKIKSTLKCIVSWMDVITITFPNLKHIYIEPQKNQSHPSDGESDIVAIDVTTTVSNTTIFSVEEKQLLRTYILYRLPSLVSIDGTIITSNERKNANALFVSHQSKLNNNEKTPCSNRRISTGRISVDDSSSSSKHQQARAKKIASQMTRTKNNNSNTKKRMKKSTSSIRKGIITGSRQLTYCLLDGMQEDKCNDEENVNETNDENEYSRDVAQQQERLILISDDAVEIVKEQSPTKKQQPSSSRRTITIHENKHNKQLEYISTTDYESSSVHAINACSVWTNACGSLSTLYNLTSKINNKKLENSSSSKQQQQPGSCPNYSSWEKHTKDITTNNDDMVSDSQRMKTDRIKTKFHLLQQNRLNKSLEVQQQQQQQHSEKGSELLQDESYSIVPNRDRLVTTSLPNVLISSTGKIDLEENNKNTIVSMKRHPESATLPSTFVFATSDSNRNIPRHGANSRLPPPCPGQQRKRDSMTLSNKAIHHCMSQNMIVLDNNASPSTPCIPRCSSTTNISSIHPSNNMSRTNSNISKQTFWIEDNSDDDESFEDILLVGTL